MEMLRLSPAMVMVVRLSARLLLRDTRRLWRQESWRSGSPEDTVLMGRGDLRRRILVLGSSARLGPVYPILTCSGV